MIAKLITTILLLQQYALIHSIHPTQSMNYNQAVAVLNAAGWDESLYDEALAIMQCESEMIPTAMGDYWGTRPQSLGLFQIHFWYYDEWDCSSVLNGVFVGYGAFYQCKDNVHLNPYNAVENAYMARLIYERSDSWAMWSCRKSLVSDEIY